MNNAKNLNTTKAITSSIYYHITLLNCNQTKRFILSIFSPEHKKINIFLKSLILILFEKCLVANKDNFL